MSGDIERELAKLDTAQRQRDAWQAWASRYGGAGFRAIREEALLPADCPHHDLLVDFSNRAITAGLGAERFVLLGPDNQLYAAQLCPWKREVPGRMLIGAERRDIRRCNARITSEGQRAVHLQLRGDAYSTPCVNVDWVVQDRKYFVYSRSQPEWHTRDGFLQTCVNALSMKRPGRR